MRQEKKIASDALCNSIVDWITEHNELSFGEDLWDDIASYFVEHYSPSYRNKQLPSQGHLIKLITNNERVQQAFRNEIAILSATIIDEFERAEEFLEQEEKEEAEEREEQIQPTAKQLSSRNKLIKSLTPAQKKDLKEAYNITV